MLASCLRGLERQPLGGMILNNNTTLAVHTYVIAMFVIFIYIFKKKIYHTRRFLRDIRNGWAPKILGVKWWRLNGKLRQREPFAWNCVLMHMMSKSNSKHTHISFVGTLQKYVHFAKLKCDTHNSLSHWCVCRVFIYFNTYALCTRVFFVYSKQNINWCHICRCHICANVKLPPVDTLRRVTLICIKNMFLKTQQDEVK